MSKRAKAPAEPNPVQTRADLSTAVATKGALDREIEGQKARLEDAVSVLKQGLVITATPVLFRMKKLLKDIQKYCEANRAELTEEDARKSCDVTTGTVGWRKDTPSVVVEGPDAEAIAKLRKEGLTDFVRTIYEVDKDAILRTRSALLKAKVDSDEHKALAATMALLAKVEQITINPGKEHFFVTPLEVKTPEVPGALLPAAVAEEVAA